MCPCLHLCIWIKLPSCQGFLPLCWFEVPVRVESIELVDLVFPPLNPAFDHGLNPYDHHHFFHGKWCIFFFCTMRACLGFCRRIVNEDNCFLALLSGSHLPLKFELVRSLIILSTALAHIHNFYLSLTTQLN